MKSPTHQPIRQHLRLSFDELFTAMCRTLFNSDSMGSYGSERLSYLLGWPSLQGPTRIPVNHQKFESYTSCLLIVRATLPILVIGQNQKCRREGWYCYAYLVLLWINNSISISQHWLGIVAKYVVRPSNLMKKRTAEQLANTFFFVNWRCMTDTFFGRAYSMFHL